MLKKDYINLFKDSKYPKFINKYLKTKSLKRLKYITYFCGCDYTKMYNPLFCYSRYDHSLVVAHMTWHFTHDKKETIAALLHDIGTPAFSHVIDYVLGDYLNQESSEIKLSDQIKKDEKLIKLLNSDGFEITDFDDLSKYRILENKKPSLCTDRLDGVLSTCYIWICKNSKDEIKEVYDNMVVLKNEHKYNEIGFKNINIAYKFSKMVYYYATEVQSNRDKFTMQYISDVIKESINKKLFDINYLYNCKEKDLIKIIKKNFSTFKIFESATKIQTSNKKPNCYYVSINTKKRNTIPLVNVNNMTDRIINVSKKANTLYQKYNDYKPLKYVFLKNIKEII